MKRRTRRLIMGLTPVVVAAAAIAAVWAPDKPVAALAARWAQPPSQFITLGGMDVHVRDEGPRTDSVPVVLLHGTSASLHTWDGWARILRGDHRVIRMDLPGFGLTGPSADSDYSIEAYVRFTLRLLDTLDVRRFSIAGNSLGGEIAWHVAAAAPDRVSRLVLVDAAGYPTSSTSVPIGFRLARTPWLSWMMTRILPRAVVRSSVRNVYGDPGLVTDSLVDRYYDLTLRTGNRASLPLRFAQSRPGADTLRLRDLRLPTLVLWGDRDRLIPPENAGRFLRDISGSRVILYRGLGHVPHEEDPVRTAADVRAFLSPGSPSAK
ncbi:MAG: alpha/beta fold hydrolase [Gemmatimonadales bacterium]